MDRHYFRMIDDQLAPRMRKGEVLEAVLASEYPPQPGHDVVVIDSQGRSIFCEVLECRPDGSYSVELLGEKAQLYDYPKPLQLMPDAGLMLTIVRRWDRMPPGVTAPAFPEGRA